MGKELSLFCVILDRSHVLILNMEKDLSGVAEIAPAVNIILMTVTRFPTNMRFYRDNDFNTDYFFQIDGLTFEDCWK